MDFNIASIEIIAQIATTVAVLLTLIGLMIQIQEKNRNDRISAVQNTINALNKLSSLVSINPELASIVIRGRGSYFSLTEVERIQFEHYYRPMLNIVENWLFQISSGANISKENSAYDTIRLFIKHHFNHPGVLEFMSSSDSEDYSRELHDILLAEAKRV
ncbi:MAG: hypothetical protein EP309_09400 [Gammaproteobacteria bacterium]|jgi:hypothetical protein|nr:MAG: hypothetical protein EP309_09400 [Gammaproteobacteria bacterium]